MKNAALGCMGACLLFVCSLFGHATPSQGQTGQPEPLTPPDRNLPAFSKLTPQHATDGWAVHVPINPAVAKTLVDQRELARAIAANHTIPQVASHPANTRVGSAGALTFTPAYTAYVPMVIYQPLGLYGAVTQNGAPAADVTVLLRFYDGVSNSTVATTTTDANGTYHFYGRPALSGGQQYWTRYNNDDDNMSRVYTWVTHYITTYAAGSDYSFGTFDIADVVLTSPAPYSVNAPPTNFTWTRRAATPSDSYQFELFDPTGTITNVYTSAMLGYTNTTRLSSMPAGFSLLMPYGWFIYLDSPDGGEGMSFYYPMMFGKSGIQGRVTLNGANASGITVQLIRYDGSNQTLVTSTSTGSDGIYQFTTAPTLPAGQYYFVKYSNSTNSTRLWAWYTAYVTAYTAGQRAYAGNFDIANVPLLSPNSTDLYYPYTFSWTRRPNTPSDRYDIEVFDINGSAYIVVGTNAYVSSYSLNNVPAGFSNGVTYGWYIRVHSPDGGVGVSYYYTTLVFR